MPNQEVLTGVAQGIDQGIRNFINIKNAMSQERERKEQSDIDFKIKKLKLKQVEGELSPERALAEQEKLKLENQSTTIANKLNMQKLNTAHYENKIDLKNKMMTGMMLQKALRGEGDLELSGLGPQGPSFKTKGIPQGQIKSVKSELFKKYLTSLESEYQGEESLWDKLTPAQSKAEVASGALKGNIKATEALQKLGLTADDFYSWAKENYSDIAGKVFPEKEIVQ